MQKKTTSDVDRLRFSGAPQPKTFIASNPKPWHKAPQGTAPTAEEGEAPEADTEEASGSGGCFKDLGFRVEGSGL